MRRVNAKKNTGKYRATKCLTECCHGNEYTHYKNLKRREGEKVEENFEEIMAKKKKVSKSEKIT